MLHDIGSRIFFKQPAGEYTAPCFSLRRAGRAFENRHLHKGAFIGIGFPWRSLFASTQADFDFAEADGFAGFQLDIARLAVAFVEQAKHRDALCHRRAKLRALHRDNLVLALLCLAGLGDDLTIGFVAAIAGGNRRQQRKQQECSFTHHDASGLHA